MQTYHLHKFHHEEMSRLTSSKTIVPHTIKHNLSPIQSQMFDEMTHENPHQKAIVTTKEKTGKPHHTPNSILSFMQFGLGEIVNFL